mmetsp:Transcript_4502/g.11686  ORF Transcript_4502/g.11686 Transcript_4502/m.11686 type:complete len:349 (-) Transcript_4502:312-1358(-)
MEAGDCADERAQRHKDVRGVDVREASLAVHVQQKVRLRDEKRAETSRANVHGEHGGSLNGSLARIKATERCQSLSRCARLRLARQRFDKLPFRRHQPERAVRAHVEAVHGRLHRVRLLVLAQLACDDPLGPDHVHEAADGAEPHRHTVYGQQGVVAGWRAHAHAAHFNALRKLFGVLSEHCGEHDENHRLRTHARFVEDAHVQATRARASEVKANDERVRQRGEYESESDVATRLRLPCGRQRRRCEPVSHQRAQGHDERVARVHGVQAYADENGRGLAQHARRRNDFESDVSVRVGVNVHCCEIPLGHCQHEAPDENEHHAGTDHRKRRVSVSRLSIIRTRLSERVF